MGAEGGGGGVAMVVYTVGIVLNLFCGDVAHRVPDSKNKFHQLYRNIFETITSCVFCSSWLEQARSRSPPVSTPTMGLTGGHELTVTNSRVSILLSLGGGRGVKYRTGWK